MRFDIENIDYFTENDNHIIYPLSGKIYSKMNKRFIGSKKKGTNYIRVTDNRNKRVQAHCKIQCLKHFYSINYFFICHIYIIYITMKVHLLREVQQTESLDRSLNFAPLPSAPLLTESRTSRIVLDQSTYSPLQTMIMTIPSTGELIDLDNSYLSQTVTITDEAGTFPTLNAYGGVGGLYQRLRVSTEDGKVIADVNEFGYLNAIVNECLLRPATHIGTSGTVLPSQATGMRYTQGVDCVSGINNTSGSIFGTGNLTRTFCWNPLQLVFQHKTLFPAYTALKIELTLASKENGLFCGAGSPSTATFSVTNSKFVYKAIKPPPSMRNYINQIWNKSGLNIPIVQSQHVLINVNSNPDDVLRINTTSKRNVTSVIVAPRVSSSQNTYQRDKFRRCYLPYESVYLQVGSTRSETYQSNAEFFSQLNQVFDGELTGNFSFSNGGAGINASPAGGHNTNGNTNGIGLYFGGNSQVSYSSHLLGFDLSSFNNNSLMSGISALPIEIGYKSTATPSENVRWEAFVINTAILNLSKANGSIIAS